LSPNVPILVLIGLLVRSVRGREILAFPSETYMAYNNLPSTIVQACDYTGFQIWGSVKKFGGGVLVESVTAEPGCEAPQSMAKPCGGDAGGGIPLLHVGVFVIFYHQILHFDA
jgi:hypothetical protein